MTSTYHFLLCVQFVFLRRLDWFLSDSREFYLPCIPLHIQFLIIYGLPVAGLRVFKRITSVGQGQLGVFFPATMSLLIEVPPWWYPPRGFWVARYSHTTWVTQSLGSAPSLRDHGIYALIPRGGLGKPNSLKSNHMICKIIDHWSRFGCYGHQDLAHVKHVKLGIFLNTTSLTFFKNQQVSWYDFSC